ncbi:hypothetical protein B0H16DRAFT_163773 [Mycena metata]|uniref:Uncharacterized protein n=1 Tax=Mycena metata TaxID=1033252 RepID=A0AAD7I324_9AGAR|nr:hypothetical protein B0H16DRAFT_163773 [Mycena metata]
MPPKHTPGDTTLIESLPMGVITAFQCSIYVNGFVIANPLLFIGNEWIDATQLRVFLQHSAPPRAETPPPAIKIESEMLPTRFSTTNPLFSKKRWSRLESGLREHGKWSKFCPTRMRPRVWTILKSAGTVPGFRRRSLCPIFRRNHRIWYLVHQPSY